MTGLRMYRVWTYDNWEKYPNQGKPLTIAAHEECFGDGDGGWRASAGPMEDASTPSEVCYYCNKKEP